MADFVKTPETELIVLPYSKPKRIIVALVSKSIKILGNKIIYCEHYEN